MNSIKQKSFEDLGRASKSDKIFHHGYHRFYPLFLERLREKKISMLEIGVYKGESIKLWSKYFSKAKIYGLDNKVGYKFDKGEVFKGDQSDTNVLNTITKKIGNKVNFIIDDGSHKPEHQIVTFNYLFPNLLKQEGIYIIEDIETSYWKNGVCHGYPIKCGYKHHNNVVEVFKNVIDTLNSEFINKSAIEYPKQIPLKVIKQISLVSFQYNSIIIKKKSKNDKYYEGRQYRFQKYL